jgi:hypothetical protein
MKKRILFCFLAGAAILGLCPWGVWAQESVLLSFGTESSEPGRMVRLPVLLQCPAGQQVAALQFDLLYDPHWVDLLSIQPGESASRAAKQLVSRPVAHSEMDSFRGDASEPRYLDMRKKNSRPDERASADKPNSGPSSGKERVVIVGMNASVLISGPVALVTLQLKDLPDRPPLYLDLANVSMAGPDAKAVPFRVKSRGNVMEGGKKSRVQEK